MNYSTIEIVLQEVPGEITICFSICGCNIRCEGCHSPFLWKENNGKKLTSKIYEETLDTYKGFASCVLFMGGEWHQNELIKFLTQAQSKGYKTCLYTGETEVSNTILNHLTWIKTGKWEAVLGGLDKLKTNQKFIEVSTNKIQNHLFL